MLERDGERTRVEDVLIRARKGVGGALLVWGAAGIGKSSLLSAARVSAAGAGMRVLRARGGELEREFGFGVVRQLFEPILAAATLTERAEWLDGVAGNAARLLGLPGAATRPGLDTVPDDASLAVLHGLYWLCAQLAGSGPVCLLVDDAQWADMASLRFLAFLLPRLEELPVAVVVAVRAGEQGPATRLLIGLAADPATDVVEPGPLSESAVGELLAAGLGRRPDDEMVNRCARASGGVPFLVGQLVEQLVEQLGENDRGDDAVSGTEWDGDLPAGPVVARWVRARLLRLGETATGLAEAAAILERGALASAAELAGLSVEEAAAAWDTLIEAEILCPDPPLTFRHPLVRRAVYDGIGRAARAGAHHRAARLLGAARAAEERVAEHLLATEPAGDPWVVARLTAAAGAASGAGAFDSSLAYLRRALLEPPGPAARSDVLLALGLAECEAGHPDAIPHLEQAAQSAADGTARITAAMTFAYAVAAGSHPRIDEAVRVLDDIIASLGPDEEATARSLETIAAPFILGDVELAAANRERLRTARRRGGALGAPREVLAVAALTAAHGNEPATTVAELVRRSRRTHTHRLPGPANRFWEPVIVLYQVRALVWAEDPAARQITEAAIRDARESSNAMLMAGAMVLRAWLHLQHGDLRGAETDALTALRLPPMPLFSNLWSPGTALAVEALVAQDHLDRAEGLLAGESAVIEGSAYWGAQLRLARARLRLAQQRPADALADCLAAGEFVTRIELDSPCWLPWRSTAALACLALGDQGRARGLADAELALARAFGAPRTLGVALRVAGLSTEGEAGERMLADAIERLDTAGAALDRARAQCDLGARLRRGDRPAESRELLRAALDTAHHLAATRLARRADTELRATGARPRRAVLTGASALTASERRIADLAADGLTNRQIAQALFITDRTVEGHLTSAFRKLEITSRGALGTALSV